MVISGVTKSAVGSGRKIQRTPSITSWNREIKIPKGVNPDSGSVLPAPYFEFWKCKMLISSGKLYFQNLLKVAILFAGNILTVQGNYLH